MLARASLLVRRAAVNATPVRHGSFTPNCSFDTIAREWRWKWSDTDEKASVASSQAVLDAHKAALKLIPGVKSVQRIVCGGCQDFKVIVALDASQFSGWKDKAFAPEEAFLQEVKKIKGVSRVETQTYTIMPV